MATTGGRYVYQENPGSLTVTQQQAGLTAGTSYEFRFILRNDDFNPTTARSYSGSAAVSNG